MAILIRRWKVTMGHSRYIRVWHDWNLGVHYTHVMDRRTVNWILYWRHELQVRTDRRGNPIVFITGGADPGQSAYVWNCVTGKAGWVKEPSWRYPTGDEYGRLFAIEMQGEAP